MTQIKKTKLYEEVIQRIEEMIKTNEMQPGDKLKSEKELAAYFGVSRMAIREALSALQAAGLLEVRHGSGIFIRDVNKSMTDHITLKLLNDRESLLNILELRKGLETEGAFLAALRADDTDLNKMEEYLEKMRVEIEKGGSAAHEDFKFHCALIKATHNPVYSSVFDSIAAVFNQGLTSSHDYFRVSQGPRLVVLDEHYLIYDCIKKREPERAKRAMRNHLENVELKLRNLL